ncbi:hypothetical protein LPJ70_007094, partial [Coemansia sp. RSA 2708]
PTDGTDIQVNSEALQPAPATITAAPEAQPAADVPDDLATDTAGMRFDDQTDPKQEMSTAQK